jgi:hypothetical protein
MWRQGRSRTSVPSTAGATCQRASPATIGPAAQATGCGASPGRRAVPSLSTRKGTRQPEAEMCLWSAEALIAHFTELAEHSPIQYPVSPSHISTRPVACSSGWSRQSGLMLSLTPPRRALPYRNHRSLGSALGRLAAGVAEWLRVLVLAVGGLIRVSGTDEDAAVHTAGA